jgi:hypothetical protein
MTVAILQLVVTIATILIPVMTGSSATVMIPAAAGAAPLTQEIPVPHHSYVMKTVMPVFRWRRDY